MARILYDTGPVVPGRTSGPSGRPDPRIRRNVREIDAVKREGLFLHALMKALDAKKAGGQASMGVQRRLASGGGALSLQNPNDVTQGLFDQLIGGYRKRRSRIPVNTGQGSIYDL